MSNTATRILVGVIGIPLFIFLIYKGGIYFLCLSLILSSIALWEFYLMFKKEKYFPLIMIPIAVSAIIIVGNYLNDGFAITFLPLAAILIFSSEIFRKEKKNPLNSLIVIGGLVYITVPFVMLNKIISHQSFNYIIFIFVLIWTCDTMAFFGGKFFGKHKLSEISPKKTWEGSIAGFLFTIIAALIVYYFYSNEISLKDALCIGIMAGIFSQVGDLFESLIKRKLGVKDSSNIIPGHGGVLDRFDSLIFVTPLIFLYLEFSKFFIYNFRV
ncbi:MAG: phosphatidate cytidylyltransferase [Bacteroidetes bacterium]|nr:phosphatidate cytidylyltransferase [Bacteroidota bacterium]